LCAPNLQMLFLCKLDLKEMPKQYLKGNPNFKVLDLNNNKYLQIFTLINLGFALLCITSDDQLSLFFLCFCMVSNNSSLFMSISNLIWININIMDMKKHTLIFLFISMLVGREK
jgi:hypothetical protein